MRGLILIVADASPERFRTALVLAAAQAALGARVRFFFQGDALRSIVAPIPDPDGARQAAMGLPTLAQLVREAIALGVSFAACQSSLALLGLKPEDFDPCIEWGGMVGLLSSMAPEDRLVVV